MAEVAGRRADSPAGDLLIAALDRVECAHEGTDDACDPRCLDRCMVTEDLMDEYLARTAGTRR